MRVDYQGSNIVRGIPLSECKPGRVYRKDVVADSKHSPSPPKLRMCVSLANPRTVYMVDLESGSQCNSAIVEPKRVGPHYGVKYIEVTDAILVNLP